MLLCRVVGSTVATVACTLGEVVFVAAAAGIFVTARRRHGRS